jgi:hypothetical protein
LRFPHEILQQRGIDDDEERDERAEPEDDCANQAPQDIHISGYSRLCSRDHVIVEKRWATHAEAPRPIRRIRVGHQRDQFILFIDRDISGCRPERDHRCMLNVTAGAFTASILFDMLSLVADSPNHADTYERRAADLLRLGLGTALSSVALEITEYLRGPANGTTSTSLRTFALNGAVIAVYLLDVAERQKQIGTGHAGAPAAPLGLSLLGLVLLGISGKVQEPALPSVAAQQK